LARALYRDSDLLLLDEPLASLDKNSEEDMIKILQELSKTMILVTHRHDILKICNRVFYVERGLVYERQKYERK
ncbi:cysteine/glutathione ABC transporter permease/ATP-binding protein CydD, partial [bacterium 1XD42-8]